MDVLLLWNVQGNRNSSVVDPPKILNKSETLRWL